MNTRKNYNSALVLATLGVYLGLVLAGATPQVLAQAATAKQYELKQKEKRGEDVDLGPYGLVYDCAQEMSAAVARKAVRDYTTALLRYFREAALEQAEGRDPWRKASIESVLYNGFDSPFASTCRDLSTHLHSLTIGEDGFGLGLQITSKGIPFDPFVLLTTFGRGMDIERDLVADPKVKLLLQNSSLCSYDSKLFICTYLPRGSLDSLLQLT